MFFDNKRHGEGFLMFLNGDKYEGHFIDDEYEGEGIFTYADGKVINAFWKKGEAKEQLDID
jgi:hypothetical protein